MSIPAHVLDHLVRSGTLAPDGSGRRAKLRPCPTCGVRVLVGDDDDTCALTIHAELAALGRDGERWAHLSGRRTVDLTRSGRGLLMYRRGVEDIGARPAGTDPREDVLAEHRCGHPVPASLTTTSHLEIRHRRTVHPSDQPPF